MAKKTKWVRACTKCDNRSHIMKREPADRTIRCPKCGNKTFTLREHGSF